MPKKIAAPADNSGAIAAQFGISTKALRLYERLGMLTPPRTEAGWRVYGTAEIERLHAILSLKQLGLPLARIAELLKAGTTDLGTLLSVQEAMLQEIRRETEHALRLVRIAKVRVRETGNLPPEELAALVRKISQAVIRLTPEIEALMQKTFTPDQLATMHNRSLNEDDLALTADGWAQLYADIDAMLPDGDPTSKEGLVICRRAIALIQVYTRGDKEMWNSSARFWFAAVNDPVVAEQLSMKKAHWDFLYEAMAELHRRGELKP